MNSPKTYNDGGEAAPRARRQRPTYVPDDPLLCPAACAVERGRGLSTFWRDVKLGRVPPAIYIGPRAPRWYRSTIRSGVAALIKSTN